MAMRVTNNMIMTNTKTNINNNKSNVDKLNSQLTTQKKISKASEDPVVAIRALRLRSSLNQINQYYDKNIPDAESWLEVTETALSNMRSVLTDIHTLCVNGSTGTLTADDRNSILSQLQALADQVYAEGNADYAGRTVFTGYKTNTTLTFQSAEKSTSYNINQYIDSSAMEEHTYNYNSVSVPTTAELTDAITGGTKPDSPTSASVQRIRLAYDGLSDFDLATNELSYTYSTKLSDGSTVDYTVDLAKGQTTAITTAADGSQTIASISNGYTLEQKTTAELEATGYAIGDNEVIYNAETGELLFGSNIASEINSNKAMVLVNYDKTGFKEGDLKPENYYDCTNTTDASHPIVYTNYDENKVFKEQDINYTVSANQTITVNTVAHNVFDSSIGRDVDELVEAVKAAINAYDIVDQITAMKKESQYASDEMQAKLDEWLTQAQRQADYADEYMKQLFSNGITNFNNYMGKVNLAITDVGSKGDRLDIIKTRMCNQQTTVEQLKSNNEDRELSDIIIDYTSAYTAYEAAMQAAAKISKQTLLDYL